MKQPNVLMIVCDQLRYDSVGYAGKTAVQTPNLDALASRGAWCENAYSATPTCCPARQEMLSGKRCESFGALWNFDITSKVASIGREQPTWSSAMGQNGYRMTYVGKWHVSDELTPLDFGYERYIPEGEYYSRYLPERKLPRTPFSWFGAVEEIPKEDTRTHFLARCGASAIREYALQPVPWHVRVDFSEPHLPCNPCREFADMYSPREMHPWGSFGDDFHGKPYIQKQMLHSWGIEQCTWKEWAEYVAHYFAVISQVDDAVGMLLQALEKSGEAENTLVLFTADHGDMAGSHRMMDKHYVLYDDTVHVPMIAVWPGRIPAGRRVHGFINNSLDLAPTMTELTGTPAFPTDGVSLVPCLTEGREDNLPGYVVSTLNGQQFGLYTQRMIRTAEWKYIWNLTDVDELYDMRNDPWEMENRIHEEAYAPLVKQLREQLYGVLLKQDERLVNNDWIRHQLLDGCKL